MSLSSWYYYTIVYMYYESTTASEHDKIYLVMTRNLLIFIYEYQGPTIDNKWIGHRTYITIPYIEHSCMEYSK